MEEDAYVVSIRAKLSRAGIKITKVLLACEEVDRNADGVIHVDDLEAVLTQLLKGSDETITKRELRALTACMTTSRDKADSEIEYNKLLKVLQPREARRLDQQPERWHDGGGKESEDGVISSSSARSRRGVGFGARSGGKSTYWAKSRGTVGEWLTNSACDTEVKNFKKLIAILETFERETGVAITTAGDGSIVVPLGPDLKATINFSNI